MNTEGLVTPLSPSPTLHKTAQVDGLDIFYREAGPADAPTILLLHGYPTSSNMFRMIIPILSASFHVIAPDYATNTMTSRRRVSSRIGSMKPSDGHGSYSKSSVEIRKY
jgi:pimeloyl-ACP methyl ester carboxylesterase